MAHPLRIELEQRERLLDEWVATRREIARLESRAAGLLGERMLAHREEFSRSTFGEDTAYRSMLAEYGAASHLSRGSIEYAFLDAEALQRDYPAVQASFADGAVTAGHVREIVRARRVLDDAVNSGSVPEEVYPLYEAAVLEIAENDTPARTRAYARQIAATLAETTLRERHASAASERAVTLRPIEDGLALLQIVLPETLAAAIYDRLTRMTRHIVRTRTDASSGVSDATAPNTFDFPDPSSDLPDPSAADEIGNTIPDTIPEWVLAGFDTGLHAALGVASELAEADNDGEFDEFTTIPDTVPEWVLAGLAAQVDATASFGYDIAIGGENNTPAGAVRDTRTFDQIRTDLLIDMLLASDPSTVHGTGLDNIQAHIQVTVAATTLAGIDDKLAELDGHGPLHPDIARDLASRRGAWTRLFLDTDAMVVETDTYSPTDGMKRFLRARDQHCRFPGCRVPAARCDIDHNHDHAKGGRTCIDNLTHLCRSHHTLKHPDLRDEDRWSAQLLPDGTVTWRSPLGRDYHDTPSRRVMFA